MVEVKCNYPHYVLKSVACILLSSLANNSAVIGRTRHHRLASKIFFKLVSSPVHTGECWPKVVAVQK